MTEQQFIDTIKEKLPNENFIFVGYKDGSVHVFNNCYFTVEQVKRFDKFRRMASADYVLRKTRRDGYTIWKDRTGVFSRRWTAAPVVSSYRVEVMGGGGGGSGRLNTLHEEITRQQREIEEEQARFMREQFQRALSISNLQSGSRLEVEPLDVTFNQVEFNPSARPMREFFLDDGE